MAGPGRRETILLVDGENIDATLGGSLLDRRPAPEERPRWDRVREYARAVWDQPVRGLFFLNASGQIPMAFVQGVAAAILRTIEALAERGHGDVLLASHDGDFAPAVATLLDAPHRRVGVLGFRELVSSALAD